MTAASQPTSASSHYSVSPAVYQFGSPALWVLLLCELCSMGIWCVSYRVLCLARLAGMEWQQWCGPKDLLRQV